MGKTNLSREVGEKNLTTYKSPLRKSNGPCLTLHFNKVIVNTSMDKLTIQLPINLTFSIIHENEKKFWELLVDLSP